MPQVQNIFRNLLAVVEDWSYSSKAAIIITLVIFATIPLTVIGVFSLRSFSPSAAVNNIANLSPSGKIQTNSPLFTWQCNCSATNYRLQLKEGDSNFNTGTWQKDVRGMRGVNTTRYGGWASLNYPDAPTTLHSGKTYYWTVICLDSSCIQPNPVSFVIQPQDSESPTIPNGLKITDIGPNSFTLAWSLSSDNVQVVGYKVLEGIGGASPTQINVTTNSFQITPYIGTQSYSFAVASMDEAGNVSNFSQSLSYKPPDKDSDQDGFLDSTELYLGTNPNAACHAHWSWPPDMNDDGIVNNLDVQIITSHIGEVRASVSSPASRYDLDKDGVITQKDVNIVKSYLGKSC